ncbi:MAG: superoxide dismutase [Verrucomicrobia bacterium]|nr:superoxide dismutase [Verrucomicrobiota bacterium]MBS0637005.1 superoxide dismutase [Verrucomicrobiota bacterium]
MQLQSKQQTILTQVNSEKWPFSLPALPFSYDALEPAIDAKTVDIHYSRHHKAYVDALNKALAGTKWSGYRLEELFAVADTLPPAIRNNSGGHWNHTFYWNCIRSPMANPGPSKKMLTLLEKNFGSFEEFKAKFKETGVTEFGSGWAWLVVKPDGSLALYASNDQANPLTEKLGKPILACDVWEHAYYLKYLNRRDEYMDAFWNVVNWQRVEELLDSAVSLPQPK